MKSSEALRGLAGRHGFGENSEETQRLVAYLELLAKWSARMNLTASMEWSRLGFLFGEALWASQYYPQGPLEYLDIGSGAGFPAVPLCIVRPETRAWLVEGRTRRAAFLETVVGELQLRPVKVVNKRVEDFLRSTTVPPFDLISWKGLKLSAGALDLLVKASASTTRFWLFHGEDLPLADPVQAVERLRLLRREQYPERAGWQLSIFGCFT